MGPVIQSTAEVTDKEIDLHVFPGQNGHFTLYEDAGLDYGYEKGRYSLIDMTWENNRKELRIGSRMGRYDGMSASRRFNFSLTTPGRLRSGTSTSVRSTIMAGPRAFS